jgi:rod shape-determining protein MreC
VERLEADKAAFDEQLKENQRLRALLELGSISELKGIAASVIANEPTGWVKAIVVNRGSAHGVSEGMAVVHPRGVVGQVVSVSPNFSRILLMVDHVSGVDAIVQDNRARGVVEGSGSSLCLLNYVAKESPVRVGDVVVTSGMDGVFPKGVIVGSVAQVGVDNGTLLQNIRVKPAVDFARLEEVLIVTGDQSKRDEEALMRAPLVQRSKERS